MTRRQWQLYRSNGLCLKQFLEGEYHDYIYQDYLSIFLSPRLAGMIVWFLKRPAIKQRLNYGPFRLGQRMGEMTGGFLNRIKRMLEIDRREKQKKGTHPKRARRWLDVWSLLLPQRVNNEDLGGYIEEINKLALKGAPAWKIYLRMVTAIFWTLCEALKRLPHELWTSK